MSDNRVLSLLAGQGTLQKVEHGALDGWTRLTPTDGTRSLDG